MENGQEFFKEIRERVSNPFLFSFCVAWLFYNWKIPIALMFYKSEELFKDGYNSYIDLIEQQVRSTTLKGPITVALIYTFLFPFFKNVILIFNAWIKAWGSSLSIRYSKSGKISIDRYINLRNTYEQRTVLLENTLGKEGKYIQENADLKSEILEVVREKNEILAEAQKWTDYNTYRVLNGEWQFKKLNRASNITSIGGEWTLLIKDGSVAEIFNALRDKKVIGRIENFHYNLNANEIVFYLNTKQIKNSNFESHFYILRTQSGNNPFYYLSGTEDIDTEVEFIKIE